MHPSSRTLVLLPLAVAAALLALTGCGGAPSPSPDQGSAVDSGSDTEDSSSDDSSGSALVVLPGTGSYAIGTEAPLGGYMLAGPPDTLSAGCTWSIRDADDEVYVDDANGILVFFTDIPEAVTFVTNGCPDWEQFE